MFQHDLNNTHQPLVILYSFTRWCYMPGFLFSLINVLNVNYTSFINIIITRKMCRFLQWPIIVYRVCCITFPYNTVLYLRLVCTNRACLLAVILLHLAASYHVPGCRSLRPCVANLMTLRGKVERITLHIL